MKKVPPSPMPLSLYSSVAWRHPFGLSQVCKWARDYGYDAIDVRGSSLHVPGASALHLAAFGYDMISPELIDRQGIQDLKQLLDVYRLRITTISCYAPLTWPPSAERDASLRTLRDYLALAGELGIEYVRSIGHSLPSEAEQLPQKTDLVIEGLRAMVGEAERYGVKLLIETNENTVTEKPEACLQILDRVGSPWLQLAVDPVNLMLSGIDIQRAIGLLQGHIAMVHVKNVRQVPPTPGTYAPKGHPHFIWAGLDEGDVDWRQLLPALLVNGFHGPIVYEYVNPFKGVHERFWEHLQPESSARDAAAFVRQVIPLV